MTEHREPFDFARAARGSRFGLVGDMWGFLKAYKRWWLTPLILVVLLFGALIVLSGTAAAPFIYTLF